MVKGKVLTIAFLERLIKNCQQTETLKQLEEAIEWVRDQ